MKVYLVRKLTDQPGGRTSTDPTINASGGQSMSLMMSQDVLEQYNPVEVRSEGPQPIEQARVAPSNIATRTNTTNNVTNRESLETPEISDVSAAEQESPESPTPKTNNELAQRADRRDASKTAQNFTATERIFILMATAIVRHNWPKKNIRKADPRKGFPEQLCDEVRRLLKEGEDFKGQMAVATKDTKTDGVAAKLTPSDNTIRNTWASLYGEGRIAGTGKKGGRKEDTASRDRIRAFLAQHPGQEFSIRGLAAAAGVGKGISKKFLANMKLEKRRLAREAKKAAAATTGV